MKYDIEYISNLLDTNDRAVGRALLALYRRQTADEQSNFETRHSNGVGFTAFDAPKGTRDAKWFESTGVLGSAQLRYWRTRTPSGRSRIGKYSRQLLEIANGR